MKNPEAHSEVFNNTREMIEFINSRNIPKEDIVTVLYIGGQLFLIYFS